MTRNWAAFWVALAVIAVALSATTYAALGQPWALGTLADWLAGGATLTAVLVALRTAREQGSLALRVAKEDRDERAQNAAERHVRFAKSMLLVATQAHMNLELYIKLFEANPAVKGEKKCVSQTEIVKATVRAIGHMTSVEAPNTTVLASLVRIEAAFGVAVTVADLHVQLFNDESRSGCRQGFQQLDDACDRLALHCVSIGARPESLDDVSVALRLIKAQKS